MNRRKDDPAAMMGASVASELGGRVEELRTDVADLTESVDRLTDLWQKRYSDAVIRRRRAIFLLAAAIILGMWISDVHTDSCVVDAYVIQQAPPPVCDLTYPLHSHGYRDAGSIVLADWPTVWNLTGFGLYGGFFVVGWWWYRRPIPGGS